VTNGPTDPHYGRTIALPLTLSVRKQLWSAWLMPSAEGRGPVVIATFGADGGERRIVPPSSSDKPSRKGDDHD
jgi:hypothetical protein